MTNHSSQSAVDSYENYEGVYVKKGDGVAIFGTFIRPADGEVLIAEGDVQEALFLVLSGNLEVSTQSEGKSVHLATLGEGDSLGEVNLFDPSTASATVISKGDSVLWRIHRSELDKLLENEPASGISLMKSLVTQLSTRIRVMNDKLVEAERLLRTQQSAGS